MANEEDVELNYIDIELDKWMIKGMWKYMKNRYEMVGRKKISQDPKNIEFIK